MLHVPGQTNFSVGNKAIANVEMGELGKQMKGSLEGKPPFQMVQSVCRKCLENKRLMFQKVRESNTYSPNH